MHRIPPSNDIVQAVRGVILTIKDKLKDPLVDPEADTETQILQFETLMKEAPTNFAVKLSITPALGQYLLDNYNTINRELKNGIQNALELRGFRDVGATIVFSKNRLLDGQNRLTWAVTNNETIEVLCAFGIDEGNAFDPNQGAKGTSGDVFHQWYRAHRPEKVPLIRNIGDMVRWVRNYKEWPAKGDADYDPTAQWPRNTYHPAELLEWQLKNCPNDRLERWLIEAKRIRKDYRTNKAGKKWATYIPEAKLAAHLYVASHSHMRDVRAFIDSFEPASQVIRTKRGPRGSSGPALNLIERLVKVQAGGASFKDAQLMAWITQAILGESVTYELGDIYPRY